MSTQTLMTAEEFAQMQTGENEDYELVEGELISLPSATPAHSKILRRIERPLEDYFVRYPIGEAFSEVDCRLTDDTVRRPDVSVFLGEHVHQIDLYKVPIPLAPDIAVEVLSPSEAAIDVHRKVREYLSAGSKEVWILDHVNRELFVHSTAGIRLLLESDVLESSLLPGFAVTIRDIFAGLPPVTGSPVMGSGPI